MMTFLLLAVLVASAQPGAATVELLRGVPLENGELVDIQIVPLPQHKYHLTADDYVDVCKSSGGQPVCNGGHSCTWDNKCAPLSMEKPYCNKPLTGVAIHLGLPSSKNGFFRDICAYVPDGQYYEAGSPLIGGACLGPDGYRSANALKEQHIQPYTLCASALQTAGDSLGFLATQGPCEVEKDCVMSPRYPLEYPGSTCVIAVLHDGAVSTGSFFSTVNAKDTLTINGQDFTGAEGPSHVHVGSGDLIIWQSSSTHQGPYSQAGWRLCLERSSEGSSAQVQNLTQQLEAEKQLRSQEEQEAQRRQADLQLQLNKSNKTINMMSQNLGRSMVTIRQQQEEVQRLWGVDATLQGQLNEARKNAAQLQTSLNASQSREADALRHEAAMRQQLGTAENETTALRTENHELQHNLSWQVTMADKYEDRWHLSQEQEAQDRAELMLQKSRMQQLRAQYENGTNGSMAEIKQLRAQVQQASQNASRFQREAERFRGNITNLTNELRQSLQEVDNVKLEARSTENVLHIRLNASQHAQQEAERREAGVRDQLQVAENLAQDLKNANHQLQNQVDHQQLKVANLTDELADARKTDNIQQAEIVEQKKDLHNYEENIKQQEGQLDEMRRTIHRYQNASSTIARQDHQLQAAAQNQTRLQHKVEGLLNNMSDLDTRLRQAHDDAESRQREVVKLTQDKKDMKAEYAGAIAAEEETIARQDHQLQAAAQNQTRLQHKAKDLEDKVVKLERQQDSWQWAVSFPLAVVVFGIVFCLVQRRAKKHRTLGKLDEPLLKAEAGEGEYNPPRDATSNSVDHYKPKFSVVEWTNEREMPVRSILVDTPGRDIKTGTRTIRGKVEENCSGVNGIRLTLTKDPDFPKDFLVREGTASASGEWTHTFDFQDGPWKVQNVDFDKDGVWQVDLEQDPNGRTWYVAPRIDMASDGEDEEPSPMTGRTRRRSSTAGTVTTQASSDDLGRAAKSPTFGPTGYKFGDLDLDASNRGDDGEVDCYSIEWNFTQDHAADHPDLAAAETATDEIAAETASDGLAAENATAEAADDANGKIEQLTTRIILASSDDKIAACSQMRNSKSNAEASAIDVADTSSSSDDKIAACSQMRNSRSNEEASAIDVADTSSSSDDNSAGKQMRNKMAERRAKLQAPLWAAAVE